MGTNKCNTIFLIDLRKRTETSVHLEKFFVQNFSLERETT